MASHPKYNRAPKRDSKCLDTAREGASTSSGTAFRVGSGSHPLLTNMWIPDEGPEHGTITLQNIAIIERSLAAIEAIARILSNSTNEPDATGGVPFDPWTTTRLLGGIESLCDISKIMTEQIEPESRG